MQQHIVPILSLKHFTDPKGQVWTYDKRSKKFWSCVPEETATEAHYYSIELEDGSMDTSIETFFAGIENDAAPIYERLAAGELPTGTDRDLFTQFLALMYVRTPQSRRMAARAASFVFQTHIAATAAHDGAFKSMLKRMEKDGVDISNPEKIRQSLMDLSHSNLILPKSYVLRILESAPKVAEIFGQMKWCLARAEGHFFVTGDTPICRAVHPKTVHPIYGDHGLLNKTVEITFPVTPERLLVLNWSQELSDEMVLPRQWVANENTKRVYDAEHQIYAHIKYRKLQAMADRHPKPSTFVRGSGFAGSTGFADVEVPRRWGSRKWK
jgi:hypothetical protein